MGNGDGTFQPAVIYGTGVNASSLALADMNNGGNTDLAVQSFDSGTVAVLLGNGNGTFQPDNIYNLFNSCEGQSLAVGDVNGDGIPDLAIAGPAPSACGTEGFIGVALGNGNGSFGPMVFYDAGGSSPFSVGIADVNGDGKPDLLVANLCGTSQNCSNQNSGTVGILLGNGDGTFQSPMVFSSGGSSGASLGSLAVADLNGDGRSDLVVTNVIQNTVGVLLNGKTSNTMTHLAVSSSKSLVGQPVTFTATVTSHAGTPPDGGTVSFVSGGSVLGTSTLSGGVASFVTSSLPAGTSLVSASYAGAPGFPASSSGTRRVEVRKNYSSTTISSNLNPAPWGVPVTFTATVTTAFGPVPDGDTVVFWDDYYTELGAANTVNGVATITTSYFRLRNSLVQAKYQGDAEFSRSHAGMFQRVEKGSSSISLTSNPNPSEPGQTVTFTATVTSPDGCSLSGGGVEFNGIGHAKINPSGVATITTSTLKEGTHSISAYYGGNVNCLKSDPAGLFQVVQ